MYEPEAVVEIKIDDDGNMMIEIQPAAIIALNIDGSEQVGVLIDTATKRLIYQF